MSINSAVNHLSRYCKNIRRDDEKAELKNFASKRKRDFLGRGTVQTVPQPNIKCSKVRIFYLLHKLEYFQAVYVFGAKLLDLSKYVTV